MVRLKNVRNQSSLKFIQEIHDLWLAPFDRPDELSANDPVAIDDIGLGPLETSIKRAGLLVRIAHRHKVDFVILQKLVISIAIDIDANPEHSHALVLEPLLQLHQGRHLLHARRAPSRPEVQDYDLAAKLAEGDLAVGVLDREVGSGGANARGPGAAIAAGKQN